MGKINDATYVREWEDAWFRYQNTVAPEGKRLLNPMIDKIYKELYEETKRGGSVRQLVDIYFNHSMSILRKALGPHHTDADLKSAEVGFIERVAYRRRYMDLRVVTEKSMNIRFERK